MNYRCMGSGLTISVSDIMDMDVIDCDWYLERLNQAIEDDNNRMQKAKG